MNPRALSLTLTALIIFNPLLAAAAAIERDAPNTYAIEPILPLQESASAEMPEGFVFKNTEDPSISINENLPASINSPENIHLLNLPPSPWKGEGRGEGKRDKTARPPLILSFSPSRGEGTTKLNPSNNHSQLISKYLKASQGLMNLKKNALRITGLSVFYDGNSSPRQSLSRGPVDSAGDWIPASAGMTARSASEFFSKIFKRSSSQPKTNSNEELAKTTQNIPIDPVQNNATDGEGDSLNQFLVRQKVPEAERPAVRKAIDRLWHILSGAGIAIGGENVEFRIGEWWQTDLEKKVVYLPLEEIIKNRNNPDALVGGVVHEGGHVDRTRWHKLPGYREFLEDNGFPQATHTLMNVLEDLFEEHAVSRRWPGAEHYLKELHHAYRPDLYGGDLALPGNANNGKNSPDDIRKIKEMFPHEEYIEALRSFWMTHKFPDPTSFVNPEVKEAVALTENAVKKLLDLVPEKIAPSEDEKVKNNYERMEHIKNEIWPHYLKLIKLSQERASQAQKSQQAQQNGQQQGSQQGQRQSPQQGQQSGQSQGQGQPGAQSGQPGGQDIQGGKDASSESERTSQDKEDGQGSGKKSDDKDSASGADKSEVERKIKEMIEERARAIEKQLSPTHGEGKENKEKSQQGQQSSQHDHHSENEKQDSVSLNPQERAQKDSSDEKGDQQSSQENQGEKEGEKERKDNTAPPGSTAKPDNQGDLGVQEILKRLLESHESVSQASKPRDSYQENLLKTAYVIDALAGRLENIFMKNARMSWEDRSYQSGAKVNIKKWMRSEANGWKNDSDFKVFQRRKMPTRRDYQFTLLVDLSGSMSGANMDYAQQLMIVFMETLERLGIDYSLMGFSNDVYMFKDFVGDIAQIKPLNMEEKEALLQKVRTSVGGSTHDTEAVYAAIRGNPDKDVSGLEDQAGERRALIVVTDGEGNGEASGQMGAALAEAAQKGITVIGVGVGAGMSYVAKRYPKYVVEASMETVPEKIGDIIEDEIQNGFEQGNSTEDHP